jgi:hypothetical protein
MRILRDRVRDQNRRAESRTSPSLLDRSEHSLLQRETVLISGCLRPVRVHSLNRIRRPDVVSWCKAIRRCHSSNQVPQSIQTCIRQTIHQSRHCEIDNFIRIIKCKLDTAKLARYSDSTTATYTIRRRLAKTSLFQSPNCIPSTFSRSTRSPSQSTTTGERRISSTQQYMPWRLVYHRRRCVQNALYVVCAL